MKRRYFFWMTAAFLAGIGFAAAGWTVPAVCLASGLFLGGLLLRKYGYTKVCLLSMLGMVVGFLCFSVHFHAYSQRLLHIDGAAVTVRGRVEEITETDRLRLRVRGSIEGDGFLYENIAVYVYPDFEGAFTYGDEILLRGEANVPGLPKNFGETNYRHYCMGKGIYGFFYPEQAEMEITGHSFSGFSPKDAAYAMREAVQKRLSGRTSEAAEGFLRALLTGDKSLMYAEAGENLRKAGLSHIVAVSGLHLQIVIGAVMALFGILKIRRRLFSVVCYLLFVWFFVLFSGASASIMRAALMLSVFFFAELLRKENDGITALAFAAFFLCLVNPGMLFDVGFQLSCAATLGILLFAAKLSERLAFLPRLIRGTLSVSLAAFVGFAPLAGYHFGTVSLVGILANILVCPLLAVIMVAGLLAVLTANVPFLSDGLFWLLDMAVRYILWAAKLCAALPGAAAAVRKPGMPAVLSYLAALVGLYTLTEKKRRRAALIACLSLALLAGEFAGVLYRGRGTVLTFLNVGNGDCAIVQSGGAALLFDSGGSTYTDVAENTVMPYLRREGVSKISAAFLTHYHTDHGYGYLSLLESGFIETLYLPYHADRELKRELAEAALAADVPVRYLGDGDTVTLGALTVSAFDSAAGSEENNGLVYRLDTAGSRVLFTGDIDKNGERRLLYRGADIDCDILKVPHHGSITADLPEFAEVVSPDAAVISCDERFYGHPSQRVLDTYAKTGAALYRTDKNGTVRFRLYGDGSRKVETLR